MIRVCPLPGPGWRESLSPFDCQSGCQVSSLLQMMWVHDFIDNNPKAALLGQVVDETIGEKNHPNNRVLTSFLYEFGKEAASCMQDSDERDWLTYHASCFNMMWDLFPNWQILDKNGVHCQRGKNSRLCLRSFCRVVSQAVGRNILNRLRNTRIVQNPNLQTSAT